MKLVDMGVLPCGGRAKKISRRRVVNKRRAHPLVRILAKTARNTALTGVVLGWALWGGIDRLGAFMPGHRNTVSVQAGADTPQNAVWIVDKDGDGIGDFANPTHGIIRGVDAYGSGRFGAVRDGGKRKHHGVDYIAAPGDWVEAPIAGVVTRMGYAYKRDTSLRYIEITNAEKQMSAKVLYLDASVGEGDTVSAGEIIGTAQDLSTKYPGGITNHVHIELTNSKGVLLDPATLLPLGEQHFAASVTDGAPS